MGNTQFQKLYRFTLHGFFMSLLNYNMKNTLKSSKYALQLFVFLLTTLRNVFCVSFAIIEKQTETMF